MSALSDMLSVVELSAALEVRHDLGAPWALDFAPVECAVFHYVESGFAWLECGRRRAPVRLSGGDVLLLPQGRQHQIGHAVGAAPRTPVQLCATEGGDYRHVHLDQGGLQARLLTGVFHLPHMGRLPISTSLPELIYIPGVQGKPARELERALAQIVEELDDWRSGSDVLVNNHLTSLWVLVLRAWLQRAPAEQGGWLRALSEPQIGRALELMHRRPGYPWRVGELADAAGMSRAAFASQFARQVGMPPIKYLNRWRQARAAAPQSR